MKLSDAITYCIHYHKINSRPNTLANYEFLLRKFGKRYRDRHIDSISTEEIIAFLAEITEGRKQNYIRDTSIALDQFIFPITYAGDMVGIKLRPLTFVALLQPMPPDQEF